MSSVKITSANVVRFKFVACVIAISFSQTAFALFDLKLPEATARQVENAAIGITGAASEVETAARGIGRAASDFRSFLPVVIVILIVQTLVGISNLIVRWRIMRTIAKMNSRLTTTALDEQSSSDP